MFKAFTLCKMCSIQFGMDLRIHKVIGKNALGCLFAQHLGDVCPEQYHVGYEEAYVTRFFVGSVTFDFPHVCLLQREYYGERYCDCYYAADYVPSSPNSQSPLECLVGRKEDSDYYTSNVGR